ncbi:MAG TPA: single-stranded DNA-binding protein [Globicatella sulfidifaciens]|jgi:single-strand DNA-binding protein|nr:single-stranded DNA-binding protein [Globicatella sulfidifaciens]
MNHVVLVGRIVRDHDLKTVNDDHRVINNTLAINRRQRNKEGALMADFIPFVAWDHLADILDKYSIKGQRIAISGRMQSRNYQNSDGEIVYTVECVVSEITLLDRPNGTREEGLQFSDEITEALKHEAMETNQELSTP